jgi:hypothetical protein
MNGSHGQVAANIYLKTSENASNTTQCKHAASQFRELRWIRKVLISMIDMRCCRRVLLTLPFVAGSFTHFFVQKQAKNAPKKTFFNIR